MTKLRTIAAVGLASGVFGGTIGALAASAVQSQASPQAIAAAVQRVTDKSAEQSLRSTAQSLSAINSNFKQINSSSNTGAFWGMLSDMYAICLDQQGTNPCYGH